MRYFMSAVSQRLARMVGQRSHSRPCGSMNMVQLVSGYPDTNCTMFIDPQGRLWLLWPTILANRWETALMKYRISSDYRRDGPPRWEVSEVLHVTPGPEFATAVTNYVQKAEAALPDAVVPEEMRQRGASPRE